MIKFIWLLDSCEPRRGPKLIKGQEYNSKDFPPSPGVKDKDAVVKEWVKTKAAELVAEKPKEEKK